MCKTGLHTITRCSEEQNINIKGNNNKNITTQENANIKESNNSANNYKNITYIDKRNINKNKQENKTPINIENKISKKEETIENFSELIDRATQIFKGRSGQGCVQNFEGETGSGM